MKRIAIVIAVSMSACGMSAAQNELVGQVKKVVTRTPIICPDYVEADVSMGLLRNGVGSLSKEDVVLYVVDSRNVQTLKRAAESGRPVKVTYDIQRVGICRPDHWLTSVSVLDDKPESTTP